MQGILHMQRSLFPATALITFLATPVLAHGTGTAASGFAYGFGHPFGGLDHMFAMVAVGILAAYQGGRALWALPLAFLSMMIIGGVMGVAGIALPFVELGIVGSVLLFGLVIALGRQLPLAGTAAMVGVLALFHGHAHGTEMPVTVSGLQYGAGFVLATALLHGTGVVLTLLVENAAEKTAPVAVRACGAAIAVAGVALFVA